MEQQNNYAFIDGQNLYLGTTKCTDCANALDIKLTDMKLSDCTCGKAWEVDLAKLRVYLAENYKVSQAYYFLGYLNDRHADIYKSIQEAGFIVIFKEHHQNAKSEKKGNVDTDIVFETMKSLLEVDFDKVILVSGDGDYKKMVYYLVGKNKFKKVLFPNKRYASSLYKTLGSEYFDYLENLRSYIEKKEKGS
jgi:uncharacterized LabA/DUF88 family protein